MRKETTEELKKFLKLTKKIKNPKDIALVIVEEKDAKPKSNFWKRLNDNISYFKLDNYYGSEELLSKIVQTQKQNKRLLIDIGVDPNSAVISFLKEVSRFGSFNLRNRKGEIIEKLNLAPGLIIVVAERNFINNQISYRNFYNLFDSAFSLK